VTLTALLLAGAAIASDAWSIERALDDALEYDSRAYVQICHNSWRETAFNRLQERAQRLNKRFADRFYQGDIILRNVDRRPVGFCQDRREFGRTIADWNRALDDIERALDGA
jgi:hypothetical protein